EPSTDGFGPPHCTVRTLRVHPQDYMENGIDIGHFQPVHKFSVEVLDAPHFDGPRMTSTYRLRRVAGKANVLSTMAPTTRAVMQGLGILFTEADLRTIGMQLRTWFCVAPLDPGRIELRTALSVRFPRLRHRGTARILAATLPKPLVWASGKNADFPIWENKIYLEHPRLAQGDGPITKYRRWARQFYSD
ncbi:hypothetical protein, partial [Streptomyces leeuwenhoekii]|uniref:hypothetical protein n=1 Tax=Streptomyces leeuwenhoekii TaxID=1437453 RepID=UPI000494B807